MRPQQNWKQTLFWSTVRVVVASRHAGRLRHPDVGTAFVVEVGSEPKLYRYYLVTARHVVEHAEEGSLFFFQRAKQSDEQPKYEFARKERFGELWYYPQNVKLDVGILPISAGEVAQELETRGIEIIAQSVWDHREPRRYWWNRSLAFHYDLEEVLFVGYPEGMWDPLSGSPIVRRGISATPISRDYAGERVFLIDGAVLPGSSGSPVVVAERELVVPSKQQAEKWGERVRLEERFIFLGMITDTFKARSQQIEFRNIGVVLKADVVFDVIAEYENLTGRLETPSTSI